MPIYSSLLGGSPPSTGHRTLADRRGAFMREAHRIAREARDLFESYRAALAYGMQAAWAQVKVARDTQAVIAGLAHRAYSPLKFSRCATRRCGASFT